MRQGPGRGYATLEDIRAQLPNDGRMRYNNFGKGVLFWETKEQGARFVNDFSDIVSADIYWFTDTDLLSFAQGGRWFNNGRPGTPELIWRAANYGATVDRMRALDTTGKPVWNFVEVGWSSNRRVDQGGRAIEPAEIRAAVWHSIIAGARGVIYFNHSFGGPKISFHVLREPTAAAQRAVVKSTNRLITQLAPVLNSEFADGFVSADPSVRTMAKFYHDTYYVFAGSTQNSDSTPTFSLTGVVKGRAAVVGEDRTIPIADGRFTDDFADGNAIHIYRIDKD